MLVILATGQAEIRTIVVQTNLGKKRDPISKITRAKKGWRCGWSDRAPV
jgi:hypothetical protein